MQLRRLTYSLIALLLLGSTAAAQRLAIVVPKEGDVSLMTRQAVIVNGRPGLRIALEVNGAVVDTETVRLDGACDFIGIPVRAGDVAFTVRALDGSNERASVRIHVSGEPDSLEIRLDTTAFLADGKSLTQVEIVARDKFGVPIPNSYLVTLSSDTGKITSPDLDPHQPGIQRRIENGAAVFTLTAPPSAAIAHLTASWGSVVAEKDVEYTTPTEPWMLVGSGNGSVTSLETHGDLSDLTDANKLDAGLHSNGRLAFYGRGSVWGNYLLTASFDNERRQRDRLFQDLDPDLLYSIYGDNSSVDYTAQSSSPLYVKLERNRSFALYGDFNTAFTQSELARYDRTFTGLKAHYESRGSNVDGFGTVTDRKVVQQEIRGEGISGFYFLSNSNVVPGSEKVRIETRDQLHNEIILSRIEKSRFNDYEIDYEQGSLFFKQPVPSLDNAGNPVYIVVSYESQSGLPTNYVAGVEGEQEILKGLTLGGTAVAEQREPTDYTLLGVNGKYAAGSWLKLAGEAARGADQNSNGVAWRVEGSTAPVDHVNLKSEYRKVEAGFVNETIGAGGAAELGTEKYSVGGTYNGLEATKFGVDYYHTLQNGGNNRSTVSSVSGTAERAFGSIASAALKVEDVGYESERLDTSLTDSRHSTVVNGRATLHATSRLSITGEYERSFSPSVAEEVKPSVGTVGAEYRVSDAVALTAEHKMYSNEGSASVFGVSSNVGYGTTVTGKYQIGNGISGQRNQASIGLKNTLKLSDALVSNLYYERTRALDRNILQVATTDHDAFSAGLEYLPKAPVKATVKGEWSNDGTGTKRSLVFGGDVRIANDLTMIDKLSLYDELRTAAPGTGSTFAGATLSPGQIGTSLSTGRLRKDRNSFGFAYRPVEIDWLNALAKIDLRREYNGMVAPETQSDAAIASLHAFVEPVQRLEIGLKYALKNAKERAYGLTAITWTDFYLVRAEYDLNWQNFDVAGEYRILSQREANEAKVGYSAELGYVLMKNLHVAAGYNFVGTRDVDLVTNYEYWSRGPYVTLRVKFTEKIMQYFQ